ncbi:Double-strand break repair protein [Trichinella spiralis]|uniref:Double-strand break repair protein n=1 Tax=Trichinella spiralis TaxID=6334 RepID=A0ABR3KLD7_TRISP
MAVHVSGFRAVSNDLDLFREQLQDGLTVKEHLNAVTLHLNKLKLKLLYSMTSIRQQYLEKELQWQVWLCDTENAIGNGKNVSRLQNTVKLQLSKYEWISEGMTSKKKQLVEEGIEILNVMSGISTTDGCGIRRKYTCRRPAETLIKSLARQRALNSWLKNSDSCCRPVKTIGFREVLQKVLSVKEQLNTVTVHLHPLNLLCTSFSCIGRMVKVDY